MKMQQIMQRDCSNGLMLHSLQLSEIWQISSKCKYLTQVKVKGRVASKHTLALLLFSNVWQ
jgi:hypothetical protein